LEWAEAVVERRWETCRRVATSSDRLHWSGVPGVRSVERRPQHTRSGSDTLPGSGWMQPERFHPVRHAMALPKGCPER